VLAPAGIRPHPRVSAFDPAYLALATVLDAPPVTTDRRLAKLPGLPSTVEVP
jgi:predicted nucleic acid-binding protein